MTLGYEAQPAQLLVPIVLLTANAWRLSFLRLPPQSQRCGATGFWLTSAPWITIRSPALISLSEWAASRARLNPETGAAAAAYRGGKPSLRKRPPPVRSTELRAREWSTASIISSAWAATKHAGL